MKIKEGLFGFDSSNYREKISRRAYSYAELATNIYRKRRAITAAKVSAVSGVAAVHVTGGASLVGTAWSARNIAVEKKKLRLLEEEWARRGQEPLPTRTLKDTVIPVVITGAIGALAFSVDLALSNAIEAMAQGPATGFPGYELSGHLVGAYYTALEKGLGSTGNAINPLSSVAPRSTVQEPLIYYGIRYKATENNDCYEVDEEEGGRLRP